MVDQFGIFGVARRVWDDGMMVRVKEKVLDFVVTVQLWLSFRNCKSLFVLAAGVGDRRV